MGFAGKVMDGVDGIQLFYIIGLFIFMILFFVILIRTIRIPKRDLMNFKTAILEDNETENNL